PLPERRLGNADLIPPGAGGIGVLPVQGNVWMINGAGANIAVSLGRDGVLLVDSGAAEHREETLKTVLELSTRVTAAPRPNDCYGLHCAESPYRWASPSVNTVIAR